MRRRFRHLLNAAVFGIASAVVLACSYSDRISILRGDSAEGPVLDFRRRIDQLARQQRERAVPRDDGDSPALQSARVDCDEFQRFMPPLLDGERRARIVAHYGSLRFQLAAAQSPAIDLPDEVPAEFRLYLSSLAAVLDGRIEEARATLAKLLALPSHARRHRSAWAYYLLGRLAVDDAPQDVAGWMHRCREQLLHVGSDPLGLAAASYGWEARAALDRHCFAEAMRLYLIQHGTGDVTASDSLWICAARLVDSGDEAQLRLVAADLTLRAVVTASVLDKLQSVRCSPVDTDAEKWLNVLAGEKVIAADADMIALAAYNAGRFDESARWLAVAADTSSMTHWLRARLAAREGDASRCERELCRAAELLPIWKNPSWMRESSYSEPNWPELVRSELAAAELSHGHFEVALKLLLRGDWNIDAAYVAEQAMNVDDAARFASTCHASRIESWLCIGPSRGAVAAMRSVVSRRLARAGRYGEAVRFAASQDAQLLRRFKEQLVTGRNESLSLPDRAAALRDAARITRHHGLELFGSELEPDWALYGGSGEDIPVWSGRQPATLLFAATTEELDNARRSAVAPQRRWHYRYLAADLAWEASYLMPSQNDETAAWLVESGRWLAARDPQAADRFYKALCRRCGETALGRRAALVRWFPSR